MPEITNPHDKFFKEVFSHPEIVKDFLFHYLPAEISARLDPNSVVPLKDTYVDYTLQEQFSDLLFSAKLKTEQELLVYVLFEHKSYPEPLIAFHLLRYMVKIWEKDWKEKGTHSFRWIVPLVIYHGNEKWNISERFSAIFEKVEGFQSYLPDFRYELFDLSRYEDEEIQGILQLRTALMLMKYICRRDLRNKLETIFQWIRELEKGQNIREFVITVLLYLFNNVDDMTYEEVEREAEKTFTNRGENTMPTIAEQLIEKGRQEGRQKGQQEGWQKGQQEGWQKGQQEGWQKGQQESILRILTIRFGSLTPDINQMVTRILDSPTLDALIKAAVTVQSIDHFKQIVESGEFPMRPD